MAWTGSMWWLPTIDGILPIGDIIYLGGIGVTAAIDSIGIDNIARFFDEVPNAFQQLIQLAIRLRLFPTLYSNLPPEVVQVRRPAPTIGIIVVIKQIQNKKLRNFVSGYIVRMPK